MDESQELPAVQPLLSVLVPAFNHAAGVQQALDSLGARGRAPDIEIIVSDDSTDMACASSIQAITSTWPNARYTHNAPSKGAVINWNYLLDQASGRYCMLLHHDEFLEDKGVLSRVLFNLKRQTQIDGIVLSCSMQQPGALPRLHMPAWIASSISLRWPRYLLRRNLLGPPSVLILRRDLYERYDTRLRWLVDMELYSRVFSRGNPHILFLHSPGIVSAPSPASITSTLAPQVATIHAAELALLAAQSRTPSVWFGAPGRGARPVRGLETLGWHVFRGLQKAAQLALGCVRFRSAPRHMAD